MRPLTAAAALAVLLSACGGAPIGTAIVASSPGALGPGPQRVLIVVAGEDEQLIGGPELPASATFSFGGEERGTVDTEWVWGIEEIRGFYVATFDFDRPGAWEVSLATDDGSTGPTPFAVADSPTVPEVGEQAPRSPTRTLDRYDLDELTTDPDPDPELYDISVEEAVTGGRPSVIVFATPAFCQTAVCGPMLDRIKELAPDHPAAEFVHVEVYEDTDATGGRLVEVPAIEDWGLLTEPWVFVVDADGVVSARFEGTAGTDELTRALVAVGA